MDSHGYKPLPGYARLRNKPIPIPLPAIPERRRSNALSEYLYIIRQQAARIYEALDRDERGLRHAETAWPRMIEVPQGSLRPSWQFLNRRDLSRYCFHRGRQHPLKRAEPYAGSILRQCRVTRLLGHYEAKGQVPLAVKAFRAAMHWARQEKLTPLVEYLDKLRVVHAQLFTSARELAEVDPPTTDWGYLIEAHGKAWNECATFLPPVLTNGANQGNPAAIPPTPGGEIKAKRGGRPKQSEATTEELMRRKVEAVPEAAYFTATQWEAAIGRSARTIKAQPYWNELKQQRETARVAMQLNKGYDPDSDQLKVRKRRSK